MLINKYISIAGAAVLSLGLSGCFDEELPEQDLGGTVVIPRDLLDDPGNAGAVYVGVFEGFDEDQLGYPYPSTGPRVGDQPVGDALPYGGSSIGSFSYACFRALRCQVVTGRFETLDQLLAAKPIEEEDGTMVTAEEMYDQCQWYFGWNTLGEFQFLADDPDFYENDDGDWEAPFEAVHTQTPDGAVLWAFADNDNTSCTSTQGQVNNRYSDNGEYWREGTNYGDILNYPDKYITGGDLMSSSPVVISEDEDTYQIVLDFAKD